MDINSADIAALEKILHWAEDRMIDSGESPHDESAPPGEPPAEEMPPGEGEPEVEIEVSAAPSEPETLAEYSFTGGAVRPKPKPASEPLPVKKPYGGKKGRY